MFALPEISARCVFRSPWYLSLSLSGIACSYNFRRPAPPQTQRIHLLEVHLRYVSSFLQDAARRVPPELGIDFEGVLRKLHSLGPEVPDRSGDNESAPASVFGDGMDVEYADSPTMRPSSMPSGASQQSFLLELVQRMGCGSGGSQTELHAVTTLFSVPLPEMSDWASTPIPSQDRAMLLIDALFSSKLPGLAFLHERHFRDMVDLVYESDTPDEGIVRFLPLLHIALALGYLCAPGEHRTHGCDHVHDQATRHYQAGQELLEQLEMNNLIALQTVVCAAIFLMSTCRFVAARPLIGLASSLALQLGLHKPSVDLRMEEIRIRAGVFVAILHLDLSASVVLGTVPFLEPREVDLALIDNLASESFRQDDWHTVTSVAQLRLLLICKANEGAIARPETPGNDESLHAAVDQASSVLKGWHSRVAFLSEALQDQSAWAR